MTVASLTQCVGLVANFERHDVVVEHGGSVILREIEIGQRALKGRQLNVRADNEMLFLESNEWVSGMGSRTWVVRRRRRGGRDPIRDQDDQLEHDLVTAERMCPGRQKGEGWRDGCEMTNGWINEY